MMSLALLVEDYTLLKFAPKYCLLTSNVMRVDVNSLLESGDDENYRQRHPLRPALSGARPDFDGAAGQRADGRLGARATERLGHGDGLARGFKKDRPVRF